MSFIPAKEKEKQVFDALKGDLSIDNVMAAPRLDKIVVSSGTGRKSRTDKHFNEMVLDRLTKITGQKPVLAKAKMSVATFKVREGDPIGVRVTLRGERMYTFFDRLIHVALPRTRDFRGIARTSVDDMGNITIGIKEHTIFPTTADEDLRDVFGLAITIVTTATNKKDALAFLEFMGVPLQKVDEE